MTLLEGMESLQLIRLYKVGDDQKAAAARILALKGKITKQPIEEIGSQWKEMPDEWE